MSDKKITVTGYIGLTWLILCLILGALFCVWAAASASEIRPTLSVLFLMAGLGCLVGVGVLVRYVFARPMK